MKTSKLSSLKRFLVMNVAIVCFFMQWQLLVGTIIFGLVLWMFTKSIVTVAIAFAILYVISYWFLLKIEAKYKLMFGHHWHH